MIGGRWLDHQITKPKQEKDMTTLEELATRLATLEREVLQLRQLVQPKSADETPAERGFRMLREARASQAAFAAGLARSFEQMGIRGEPVGAEKVQEMIAAEGIDPNDNEFSRGIIEMREE
jgi:hypothetical protein